MTRLTPVRGSVWTTVTGGSQTSCIILFYATRKFPDEPGKEMTERRTKRNEKKRAKGQGEKRVIERKCGSPAKRDRKIGGWL